MSGKASMIVKVAVEQTAFSFDKQYSYCWPAEWGNPPVGARVMVPFGGGNRKLQGLIMSVDNDADPDLSKRCKSVLTVIDDQPLLNAEMLELIRFMQERTFCTLFDAVRSILPTGLYMQIRPTLHVSPDILPETLETLTPNEKRMLSTVSGCPNGIEQSALLKRLGLDEDAPALRHLLELGALIRSDDAFRKAGDLSVRMVRLREYPDPMPKLTDKQQSVLSLLEDVGAASVKEVCYFSGVTPAVVTALAKKRLVDIYDAEVLRNPYKMAETARPAEKPVLNDDQRAAYHALLGLYEKKEAGAALLYGVTGSGKTAVYMDLINRVLQDGRQVIVLVPEISLTPQVMALFIGRYGRQVAVLHSGLAIGERTDEWKRIKRGEARVVVGTRSAVFAPCDRLGLIVMDEEQEHTYKSESAPRYHTKDVARFRCAYHKALLLLTSATPSVESYSAAAEGRYQLVTLDKRFGNAVLPTVEIADMRLDDTPDHVIGSQLRAAMQECLDENRQIILLLNRRGYNTQISCRSCGQPIVCASCSISMTYHKANNRLMCHYCGASCAPPAVCPSCGSDKLRFAGCGTQMIEQELAEEFPDIPILRMDADTTMSRRSYEEKFRDFGEGKYRIMIGTQMVAKGLDFPQVGLVGVLSADQSLFCDDYRSFETTFSLLTQVVGRAGRRSQPGKAIIQTYTPDHPVIDLAAKQDYIGFYGAEIAMRRMMHYPPYADLFMFAFTGITESAVRRAGDWTLAALHRIVTQQYPDLPLIALDPTPAAVLRVAGKYRYKMLVKAKNTGKMREMVRQVMYEFFRTSEFHQVSIYVDINPAAML